MNRKDNLIKTLNGEQTGNIPVSPHWWGLYKFELQGILHDYENESEAWSFGGEKLADIDANFFERFKPDMFHLTTGTSKLVDSKSVTEEKARLREAVYNLESFNAIEEYIEAFYPDKVSIAESGIFDHVRTIAGKYADTAAIFLNEGNPISWILDPHGCVGFENGLISMLEKPEKMEYLINGCYKALMPRMEALKEMGADGYIGSETYCSADLISPSMYRNLVFDAQKVFYESIDKMGLIPIVYFLGDINPLTEDIKALGVKGLMIEEGKKSFKLDAGEIYDKLERKVCLFGNLDSVYVLMKGTEEDVRIETERQIKACCKGAFVMSNGSPIAFSTPEQNIRRMIETARGFRQ